ncbi:MAG: prolyl oligopeptidase family serine peptidase [Elusimicrobia bacterium]|nr:prolyl oligopeptidase family serine peptidase [Elusimicrobiota bacterium]
MIPLAGLVCLLSLGASAEPIATPKRPVTDEYHGIKVTEDYQWLEKADDPEVIKWSEAQNQLTRSHLDALPSRAALLKKIQDYYRKVSPSYSALAYRKGRYFALKLQPPKDQNMLVTLKSPDAPASERVILDPNAKKSGGLLSIDWYAPSLDGRLVAVALSEKGSEDATLYFYDAATGKPLADRVPRVNFPTAGGSAAWLPDGSGVYYTRYPQGAERPKEDRDFYQQVWLHRLGTPASADTYLLGRELPRIAEIQLETRGDGRYLLATVANGDGGEFALYLMDPDRKWRQLSRFEDKVVSGALGLDGAVYLLSHQNAPRGKVLRLPLSDPRLDAAQVIVPQSESVIVPENGIIPTEHRLYVTYLAGGPNQAAIFDLAGKPLGQVPLPPVAALQENAPLDQDSVLVRIQTYLEPSAWYRFTQRRGLAKTSLFVKSPVDFRDAEVAREFAVSKDGTKVPLNIIRRQGAPRDGARPTLLYGYGGYDISLTPKFLGITGRLWLDQDGVYVVANIRGGGEYGEEWHRAGNLTRKQNVFDDFIAGAEYLIAQRYTAPGHLAIEGGSNGGLLMGAALTQRPELFRAVVSHVGIYDMLRVELSPNGVFNTTEFGTVKDPDQFRALYAYSPYHHVLDQTAYPAVLFMTGANDGRVDPANSRKMAARLQAATSSGRPVLLRTSSNSGHGMGTALSENMEQYADGLAFLFDELGVEPK